MHTWWTIARDLAIQGQTSILVTVCTVRGSAPREVGAKMLVWADGQEGTIGGGNLEFTIVDQARRMLPHSPAWRFQNYPLGPLLAQCCGGNVGVLLERIDQSSVSWLFAIAKAEAALQPYEIISEFGVDNITKRISSDIELVGRWKDTRVIPADTIETIGGQIGQGATVCERMAPRARLLMFGAGHVGKAVFPVLAALPFHIEWFDTRKEFAVPGVELVDDPVNKVRGASVGSMFLIFTQSHTLDYDLTRAVLARGDFRYCGLIGSATKRARFEKRLKADGLSGQAMLRLNCPIGAVGLKSKVPQIIAVAVATELLFVLQGAGQMASQLSEEKHVG